MSLSDDRANAPKVCDALAKLKQELQSSGYDATEIETIAAGAHEHVGELLARNPSAPDSELVAAINGFSDPEIAGSAPQAQGSTRLIETIALASGLLGVLIVGAAFFSTDPDRGGALMLLGVFLGGGLALVLGFLSRRTQRGQVALVMSAVLWLSLAGFLALS